MIFHPFIPTPDKLEFIRNAMLNDKESMIDDQRTPEDVDRYISSAYVGSDMSFCYEIGDFCGVLAFVGIKPGFKASMLWHQWDFSIFNKTLVREAVVVITSMMGALDLHKVEIGTGETRVARLARMLGFEDEGVKKDSMRWGGKLHDMYLLGKRR